MPSPRAARVGQRASWLAAIAAATALVSAPVRAGEQVGDVQVKAAFLLNVIKFVQWPTSSNPLVIGVIGDRALAAAIGAAVKTKTGDGRAIEVRGLEAGDDPSGCDVLHVGDAGTADTVAVLSRVRGPVLTVGETPRFLRDGGIIRMFIEDRRIRFQVNRAKADDSGLRISSQLLSLAVK